jgi:hypothetical protein
MKLAEMLKLDQILVLMPDGSIKYIQPLRRKVSVEEIKEGVAMLDISDECGIELAPASITGFDVFANSTGLLIPLPLNYYAQELILEWFSDKKKKTYYDQLYAGPIVFVPKKLS